MALQTDIKFDLLGSSLTAALGPGAWKRDRAVRRFYVRNLNLGNAPGQPDQSKRDLKEAILTALRYSNRDAKPFHPLVDNLPIDSITAQKHGRDKAIGVIRYQRRQSPLSNLPSSRTSVRAGTESVQWYTYGNGANVYYPPDNGDIVGCEQDPSNPGQGKYEWREKSLGQPTAYNFQQAFFRVFIGFSYIGTSPLNGISAGLVGYANQDTYQGFTAGKIQYRGISFDFDNENNGLANFSGSYEFKLKVAGFRNQTVVVADQKDVTVGGSTVTYVKWEAISWDSAPLESFAGFPQ